MLQLEALQANDGDCLLLRYGAESKPSVILIDGGSAGVYRDVLSKRLDQLRGRSPTLNVRLVVASHIDADHITGLVDMFKQMSESVNNGVEPRWKVTSLWHNAFEKVVGSHAPSSSTATVEAAASGAQTCKISLTAASTMKRQLRSSQVLNKERTSRVLLKRR